MEPFLTLDEALMTSRPTPVRTNYFQRKAARAVVFDNDDHVALLHVKSESYYKLPGGGLDPNEAPLQALERELLEEIGCRVVITNELGTVLEHRDHHAMTQLSYCYTARLTGKKGMPNFTEKELAEGFEIVWAKNINDAIKLLQSSSNLVSNNQEIPFMRQRDTAITKRAKEMLTL